LQLNFITDGHLYTNSAVAFFVHTISKKSKAKSRFTDYHATPLGLKFTKNHTIFLKAERLMSSLTLYRNKPSRCQVFMQM